MTGNTIALTGIYDNEEVDMKHVFFDRMHQVLEGCETSTSFMPFCISSWLSTKTYVKKIKKWMSFISFAFIYSKDFDWEEKLLELSLNNAFDVYIPFLQSNKRFFNYSYPLFNPAFIRSKIPTRTAYYKIPLLFKTRVL